MKLILISVLPIFIIGFFVYMNDREKEPLSLLFKLLFLGACSSIPIIVIESFLRLYFPIYIGVCSFINFFHIFVSVALIEEIFKYGITYFISYNNKNFCNLYDMIVYATFVSLGFALVENIFYVLDNGVNVGILRSLFSVPGHACYGIVMGYFLGLAKISDVNKNKKKSRMQSYLGLLLPVLMHTFYDFCLFSNSKNLLILFLIYVIGIYIFCLIKVKSISKNELDFKKTSID